jgi:hypothetical protein
LKKGIIQYLPSGTVQRKLQVSVTTIERVVNFGNLYCREEDGAASIFALGAGAASPENGSANMLHASLACFLFLFNLIAPAFHSSILSTYATQIINSFSSIS